MKKKAVSPVIATVLLIAIVVVLSLIIFIWAKGVVKEVVMKKGMNADQACDEIKLDIRYIGSELQITNKGNIPVSRFEFRGKSGGSVETIDLGTIELQIGKSVTRDVEKSYEEITITPVILGEVETSRKIYVCKNSFTAEAY